METKNRRVFSQLQQIVDNQEQEGRGRKKTFLFEETGMKTFLAVMVV